MIPCNTNTRSLMLYLFKTWFGFQSYCWLAQCSLSQFPNYNDKTADKQTTTKLLKTERALANNSKNWDTEKTILTPHPQIWRLVLDLKLISNLSLTCSVSPISAANSRITATTPTCKDWQKINDEKWLTFYLDLLTKTQTIKPMVALIFAAFNMGLWWKWPSQLKLTNLSKSKSQFCKMISTEKLPQI